MKIGNRSAKRVAIAVSFACLLLSAAEARSLKEKREAARVQFEAAQQLRDTLDRRPERQRTRRDYQKVIEAYRGVYHTAPESSHAAAAVLAVAELLDEQGRLFNDPQSYRGSIGQLVLLRREYPRSEYRAEALFHIAEIYRDDLNDSAKAKATFQDYLKYYPHTRLAPEAGEALADLNQGVESNPRKKAASDQDSAIADKSKPSPKVSWGELKPSKGKRQPAGIENAARVASQTKTSGSSTRRPADEQPAAAAQKNPAALQRAEETAESGLDSQAHKTPRLTNVRYWSTPDYTRVAIDVEQEVEYQVGRVPNPDRIFFDLRGVKLGPDLAGKSFDVQTGFLQRIRLSQYKSDMARVVLDVHDVADYSAFLLPNPYRLIIDIHGKNPPQRSSLSKSKAVIPGQVQASDHRLLHGQPSAENADNEVSVTHIHTGMNPRPMEGGGAAAIDQAENGKAGPLKGDNNEHEAEQADSSDSMARAEPPKETDDDDAMDEPTHLTGRPTTGPTYHSISPQESSRTTRTARSQSERITGKTPTEPDMSSARVAVPTAAGERSLTRTLGLKIGRIVVDAGHGGHDRGTVGPNGVMEKELVLDVALKLGKLLENRLGADVVYTRHDDTFIPLETRTAIANEEQADLFISIHANSSSDTLARGVETYYLNFTSSPDALEVAARENAVSQKSIHELQDLVKKIALKEKIEESREFAADVQESLYNGLSTKGSGIRNRGVKKAPFVVLIGANMPSILAEIAFLSNPTDARKVMTNEYRQRIAELLYKGINKYISGLSGVKVASKVASKVDDTGRVRTASGAK